MKKSTKIALIITAVVLIVSIIVFSIKKNKSLGRLPVSELEKKVIEISENGKTNKVNVYFSPWFAAYENPFENKKTMYPKISNKAGVYLIRSVKDRKKILYVGFSASNLYKALYRHFQYYNDKDYQNRTEYEDVSEYEVMIYVCKEEFAHSLERYFIKTLKPIDNWKKYAKTPKVYEIPF